MGTTRDKSGRSAKQPAHKFEVGDLVDCDADDNGGTSAVIGGRILIAEESGPLVRGVLFNGKYAVKKEQASWVSIRFVRPHVPAPKAKPVKTPQPKSLPSGIAMQAHDRLIDALEAAKREAEAKYRRGTSIAVTDVDAFVEIGFRAGQKAGGDAIKALGAKSKALSGKALKMIEEAERLDAAIAILKGGE